MKFLVFGKTGQVATELAQYDDVICLGREQADLTDPSACEAVIASTRADAVINAAAYTAVDRAESDRETAMIVNSTAPKAIAKAAAQRGIPFVHLSTDYVFDGAGNAPFTPKDTVAPQNVYGTSKLAGERGVVATESAYAVLRTSWIFSAFGTNFVKTMLRLGAERDSVRIVADQVGGPTPAKDIAAACMTIAQVLKDDPRAKGLYHLSGAPDVSWAHFAREIFKQAGLRVDVADVPSSDYPTPAARPLNSRLDCSDTESVFGIQRPDWRTRLGEVITELQRS